MRGGAGIMLCLQALLTGLSVMLPVDPWQFIIDKISQLEEAGAHIHWYD